MIAVYRKSVRLAGLGRGLVDHLLAFVRGEERAHGVESRSGFEPLDLRLVEGMVQFDGFGFAVRMFQAALHLLAARGDEGDRVRRVEDSLRWVPVCPDRSGRSCRRA